MPKAAANARTRVLVVEDDVDAREIYEGTLRFEGYDVTTAGSIAEARRAASVRRPDLVVLDCRLPDGYGTDLLRHWRRNTPAMAEVPVVVITAFSQDADVQAAAQAGADAFFVKPCSTETLTTFLSKVEPRVRKRTPAPLRMSEPAHSATSAPTTGGTGRGEAFYQLDDGKLTARCYRCFRGSPVLGLRTAPASTRATGLGWRLRSEGWCCPICVERDRSRKSDASRVSAPEPRRPASGERRRTKSR